MEAEARWGEVENLEGGVLSLVEGEEVEVVCEGRGGYPAPAFLWDSHPPPMGGDEGKRMGRSGEEEKSEGKEVAERSVELELFNPDQGAIPLNTTSKVRTRDGSECEFRGQEVIGSDRRGNSGCRCQMIWHPGPVSAGFGGFGR